MTTTKQDRLPDGAGHAPHGENRLSILIVSHYYPPHVGGIERAVQTQAEHLAGAGHRVTVATTAPGGRVGRDVVTPDLEVVRVPTVNLIEQATRVPFPIITPSGGRAAAAAGGHR